MQWWQTHLTTEVGFTAGQLVILDETSLAGTLWALTLDFGHGVSGGYAAIDSVAVALAS